MTTRIHDMPVYASCDGEVAASLYNVWRRAKLHLALPLRIELQGMKQMRLIVEEDCWVVVDENQYDLPILAWLEFQDSGRSSLHTPVTCRVNTYHYLAHLIKDKVLEHMGNELEVLLHESEQ